MKIAIQGGLGSYSHIAAVSIFGKNIELMQEDTFEDAIAKCKTKEVDYSVIPFENSTHGSVIENFDLLTKYELAIVKEIYLKIHFHLMVNRGVEFKDIKNLYTHRVSISQIRKFIESNHQIHTHIYSDNGKAAEYIKKEHLTNSAAAASKLAAELFDLEIIKHNIHDNPKNYTRFFVLSRQKHYPQDADKTSISFIVKHETGSLVKALSCFSDEGISLTKIESRPIIGSDWEYIFYVDLLAGINNPIMQNAIKSASRCTIELKILGSYKQGIYIDT